MQKVKLQSDQNEKILCLSCPRIATATCQYFDVCDECAHVFFLSQLVELSNLAFSWCGPLFGWWQRLSLNTKYGCDPQSLQVTLKTILHILFAVVTWNNCIKFKLAWKQFVVG